MLKGNSIWSFALLLAVGCGAEPTGFSEESDVTESDTDIGRVSSPAETCAVFSGTNDEHVAAGRARKESLTLLFFTFDFYYATGSNDFIGLGGTTQSTLYETGAGTYSVNQGQCEGGGGDGSDVPLTANCKLEDLAPQESDPHRSVSCSSVVTPAINNGQTVTQLGPYGTTVEPNVGEGFEIPPNPLDTDFTCALFAASFGEDPRLTANVIDLRATDLSLYSVFRPARWVQGEKYPIITWGNGTCAQPGSYGAVLMHLASHGFFVIAANGRFVANGAQTRALDFAFAANEDPSSPYYQRLDTTKVGAMGHSQGGAATIAAALDPRVDAVIVFNGGRSASKPFLTISGDRDIGNPTAQMFRDSVNTAPKGAFIFYHQVPQTGGAFTGHLTLMMEPNRVVDATTGWWKYILNGDPEARNLFVGPACGLCNQNAQFEYGARGLN